MENNQKVNKASKERKFSTNQDLTRIKEVGDDDRKYMSITDEYRRYYGVQKRCRTRNLTREEMWEFVTHFFKETYGIIYNSNDEAGKKFVGKLDDSKHRRLTHLHWNVEGYEFSIDEQRGVLHRTSLRIGKRWFGGFKLYFKHMIKSGITIGGMQGDLSKFQLKYSHRQNSKEIFRSLKKLDKYKKEHNNIEDAFEYLKQEADAYKLAKYKKLQAKGNN